MKANQPVRNGPPQRKILDAFSFVYLGIAQETKRKRQLQRNTKKNRLSRVRHQHLALHKERCFFQKDFFRALQEQVRKDARADDREGVEHMQCACSVSPAYKVPPIPTYLPT